MKLFCMLKKYWLSLLLVLFTVFLCGFFFTEYLYNSFSARYVYVFNSDSEDINKVLDVAFYDDTFTWIDEYNQSHSDEKISYAVIDYESMLESASLKEVDGKYELSILKKYFPSILKKNGLVNQADNRVVKYFNLVFKYGNLNCEFVELRVSNYQNPYLIGGISAGCMLGILILLMLIGYKHFNLENIEDNKVIFKSIFHKEYWKGSIQFSKNVKSLCMISILFALMMLCKLIPIPSGFGSLGLGITYLVFATICMIYGPICGLFVGFCSDVIGYFINQGGQVFFIGYTLDAMLSGFIYGICFYKKKITFANCLLARFFVNIVVNVGLGCLWWKIIYGLDWNGYVTYLTLTSLPKNVLYLLPQSILLFILFKLLLRPLASFNLVDAKISENVSLF